MDYRLPPPPHINKIWKYIDFTPHPKDIKTMAPAPPPPTWDVLAYKIKQREVNKTVINYVI